MAGYESGWMNPELQTFRDAVRRFVQTELVPHDYPIAQMYADARVQRIYGGANKIMTEIVARSL